ncbi:MAG: YajG family lipoprotein [Spongiibacteraceae bacterium]
MKKLLQIVVSMSIAVWLAACAYSPQQLNVQPVLTIGSGESFGNGRPIAVSASDQRSNKVLGNLGGVYANSSTITIANDLDSALSRAANGLLATQGFVVNSADPSAVQLNIIVENITYATPAEGMGATVKLHSTLRAEGVKGGETFSGRYESDSERRMVSKPDAKENEKLVSDLLSNTLRRMFEDPRLREFLTQ